MEIQNSCHLLLRASSLLNFEEVCQLSRLNDVEEEQGEANVEADSSNAMHLRFSLAQVISVV